MEPITTKSGLSPAYLEELKGLSHAELIERLLAAQEEARLKHAFAHIADTGTTDAALMWQGRNRFLNERVIPVQLAVSEADSFQVDQDTVGNRIISGDNLSVMASLLTEFKGGRERGVDIIYLDPPYNTGSDTFAYNDNYRYSKAEVKALQRKNRQTEKTVSLDDVSRHTKWINHIAPRLWQAKKLLKNTGVVIASIDEHELPRLWLLMEELFGPSNRIATLVWERARKNDAKYISEGHEYMLVWAKDKAALDARASALAKTPQWANAKGRWRKRKDGIDAVLTAYGEAKAEHGDDITAIQAALDRFFADLPKDHPARRFNYRKVDERGVYREGGDISWPGGGGPRYDVLHPVTKQPVKVPPPGWRFADIETMHQRIAEGKVRFGKDHTTAPSLIYRLDEMDEEVQTSVIQRDSRNATDVIKNLFLEKAFENPKDHELLAELFALVTWRNKNAVVLDPYAGSGTTAHAVLALNAEDNGSRRFILIENGDPKAVKQGKIASRDRYTTDITAERVRRVITGQWADGKPHPAHKAGFQFFTATKEIDRDAIMGADRENLADIILQVVEEDSNRLDCRMEGDWKYLIGKTRTGYGIALIWEKQDEKKMQPLTDEIVDIIADEAKQANVTKPVFVYAVANTAAFDDSLYRFQHIPDSILARLNLLPGDENDGE